MGLSRKVAPPCGFETSKLIFDIFTLIHWYLSSQLTTYALVSSRIFSRRTPERSLANAAPRRISTCFCGPVPEGHSFSIPSAASHRISSILHSNQTAIAATHENNKSAFLDIILLAMHALTQQDERKANSRLSNR